MQELLRLEFALTFLRNEQLIARIQHQTNIDGRALGEFLLQHAEGAHHNEAGRYGVGGRNGWDYVTGHGYRYEDKR